MLTMNTFNEYIENLSEHYKAEGNIYEDINPLAFFNDVNENEREIYLLKTHTLVINMTLKVIEKK